MAERSCWLFNFCQCVLEGCICFWSQGVCDRAASDAQINAESRTWFDLHKYFNLYFFPCCSSGERFGLGSGEGVSLAYQIFFYLNGGFIKQIGFWSDSEPHVIEICRCVNSRPGRSLNKYKLEMNTDPKDSLSNPLFDISIHRPSFIDIVRTNIEP